MTIKIQDYTFSTKLRKETELVDFVEDVKNIINSRMVSVLQSVSKTAQTGDISTTTIITPSTAFFFRVNVYMICTTAGGGTLSCTIGWTDEAGSKTIEPASSISLASTANGSTGMAFIKANASAITYSTAIASKTGNPEYSLYIVLEQLG